MTRRKQENTIIKTPLPPRSPSAALEEYCDFHQIESHSPEIKSVWQCSQCRQRVTLLGDVHPPVEKCRAWKPPSGTTNAS
jgi:hypothetical protein